MKKEKGITLVSLVVTIIILIILAGVSINLTLGKNGIITIAKQAKENTELAKIEEETALNELYMQIETEGETSGDISYDAIAKLTEFKTAIANYIEEAGGIKPETTADATAFGESIKGILKEATKDATATSDDIEEGKTAYVNGKLITGTKSNVGYGEVYYDFGYRTWVDVRNVKTLSYYGNKINGQTNLNIIYGLKGESNKYNYDNGTVIHNTSTSEGNLYTIDISDYDYLELYLLAGAKEMVFSK